jgi:hypothetical protein
MPAARNSSNESGIVVTSLRDDDSAFGGSKSQDFEVTDSIQPGGRAA